MADDDPEDCELTRQALAKSRLAEHMRFVFDGQELMDYLRYEGRYADRSVGAPRPSIILLDLNMPKKDGREALAEIKADRSLRQIPVVVLTTSKDDEDVLRTYDLGASSYITKPVTYAALVEAMGTWEQYWFHLAALPKPRTLRAFNDAMLIGDRATREHARRVADIAEQLASDLGWTEDRRVRLREAALLHDIGKIVIHDSILNKPAALTANEYEQVKTHPAIGAEMVKDLLQPEQVSWIRSHHERPDGRGYPDQLTADVIPDGALILSVADAYDAMTTLRPYRPARSVKDALSEMRRNAGTQFDQAIVDLLRPRPAWTTAAAPYFS